MDIATVINIVIYFPLFIAICPIFFGIYLLFKRIYISGLKELPKILKTLTSILLIITVLFTVISPLITNFMQKYTLIFLLLIGISTLMLSRSLTIALKDMKNEILSWYLTILFGIGSYGIFFLFVFAMLRCFLVNGWAAFFGIVFGAIVGVLSILINTIERIRINKRKSNGV